MTRALGNRENTGRSRRANSNLHCIRPGASQHQGVTRTDHGVSADRSGITEAVSASSAADTDAREVTTRGVGPERIITDRGVVTPGGVFCEREVAVGRVSRSARSEGGVIGEKRVGAGGCVVASVGVGG